MFLWFILDGFGLGSCGLGCLCGNLNKMFVFLMQYCEKATFFFFSLRRRKISIRKISFITLKGHWEVTKKIEEINVLVSQLLLTQPNDYTWFKNKVVTLFYYSDKVENA